MLAHKTFVTPLADATIQQLTVMMTMHALLTRVILKLDAKMKLSLAMTTMHALLTRVIL
jgi:hypothetical protein